MSTASVDISYYAPGFTIEINGSELSAEVSKTILSLTIEQALNSKDRPPTNNFRFEVQDEFKVRSKDKKEERFEWLGHDLFKYGNNVSVFMGYTNNMHKMVEGKISEISANFFQGTAPTFTVGGVDSAYEFLAERGKPDVFESKKYSDIARKIAQKVNLKAVVDETKVVFPIKVKKGGKSYFEFLAEIAASEGYEFYLSGRNLFFIKSQNPKDAILSLEWGKELISFTPTLNLMQAITEVIVRGWNRTRKEPIEVRVKPGEETKQEEGKQSASQVAREIYGDVIINITDKPLNSVEEARQIAMSKLDERSDKFITGKVNTIGIPELKPGVCVEINGLGKWFSGKYYIEQVTHTIDSSGYRSSFEVRRNAI